MDWGLLARPPAVPFSSYLRVIRLPHGNVGDVPPCLFKREIKKENLSMAVWPVSGGAMEVKLHLEAT